MTSAAKKCFKSRFYYSGKSRPTLQETTVIDKIVLILLDLKRRGCPILEGATQGSTRLGGGRRAEACTVVFTGRKARQGKQAEGWLPLTIPAGSGGCGSPA